MRAVPLIMYAVRMGWQPLSTRAGAGSADVPRFALILGLFLMVAGFLLFRHRQAVGESTNYVINCIPVTARTPGCIVGIAGVVAMLAGGFLVVAGTWRLLAG